MNAAKQSIAGSVPDRRVEGEVVGRDVRVVDRRVALLLDDRMHGVKIPLTAILGRPLGCRHFEHAPHRRQLSHVQRPEAKNRVHRLAEHLTERVGRHGVHETAPGNPGDLSDEAGADEGAKRLPDGRPTHSELLGQGRLGGQLLTLGELAVEDGFADLLLDLVPRSGHLSSLELLGCLVGHAAPLASFVAVAVRQGGSAGAAYER